MKRTMMDDVDENLPSTKKRERPIVLLHKCSECTTFALSDLLANKPPQSPDIFAFSHRFARLRFASAPPTIEEHVCTSLDDGSVFEGENEESDSAAHRFDHHAIIADGLVQECSTTCGGSVEDSIHTGIIVEDSGTSGHNSLEDSPVGGGCVSSNPVEIVNSVNGISPARLSKSLRHRSVSECEGIAKSPIKGILKRQPFARSLSECDESQFEDGLIDASNDCLLDSYVSESGGDDSDGNNQSQSLGDSSSQSPYNKKSVRFNDLVQQTLFRPNSRILAHQKKRRQHHHHHGLKPKHAAVVDQQSMMAVVASQPQQEVKSVDVKVQKSMMMGDKRSDRYAGFVIGRQRVDSSSCDAKDHQNRQSADGKSNHWRHTSGDSALGDDEIEASEVRICASDTKDSGIDEEV